MYTFDREIVPMLWRFFFVVVVLEVETVIDVVVAEPSKLSDVGLVPVGILSLALGFEFGVPVYLLGCC